MTVGGGSSPPPLLPVTEPPASLAALHRKIVGERLARDDWLALIRDVAQARYTKIELAALVVALRRPQGATSLQLMLATGWQPHTVRGAISGMLRKKLGLNVVLAHNDSGERVYRVV